MAVEMLKEVERSAIHGLWHSYRWLHNPHLDATFSNLCKYSLFICRARYGMKAHALAHGDRTLVSCHLR